MTRARVVALGSPVAGDDGVGAAVLAELQRRAGARDLELRALASAIELLDVLLAPGPVVLVDAVIAAPIGAVFELAPDQLAGTPATGLHDLDAAAAIRLARALAPHPLDLRIVAIAIAHPRPGRRGLSSEIGRAVAVAADRVLGFRIAGDRR